MYATIWALNFGLPEDLCYNCGGPPSTTLPIRSKGGMAGSGVHGAGAILDSLTVGLVNVAQNAAGVRQVPYCASCASGAQRPRFLDRLPRFLTRQYLTGNRTAFGSAFEILNAGKDILRGNREFVRIRYTNPQVLARIRHLNPDVRISE